MNTKSRHEEIRRAAQAALAPYLDEIIRLEAHPDPEIGLARYAILANLVDQVKSETGCTPEAARRNLKRIIGQAKFGKPPSAWGGKRPGSGRPHNK